MKTLKEFHTKEFKYTGIRKYWIVENSLDIFFLLSRGADKYVLLRYRFDVPKMNQASIIESTAEEIRRAASIMEADSLFIVVGDMSLGNKIDQAFWCNTESGLDPSDKSIPSTKDKCSKRIVYPIPNIINILSFLVQNSYVTIGNSVHPDQRNPPRGTLQWLSSKSNMSLP
jgi:hypothetical protein